MTESVKNPLLETWATPFGLPPYPRIETAHYGPAFDAALAQACTEVEAIAAQSGTATFVDTVEALERSGTLLDRVASAFYTVAGANTSPAIQALERDLAPKLAAHRMALFQNQALFARIESLMERRASLGLDEEQGQVLERYHRGFVKSGARLDAAGKARLSEIAQRLSTLATAFGQNVLKDEQDWSLELDHPADTGGLPASLISAAAAAASERGRPGKHLITLSRSLVEPFLQYSDRRDLREIAYAAWARRGANGGETDNRAILAEIVKLRNEQARLLGFGTFADSSLEFTMAKTPAAVRKLLDDVWGPAVTRARQELATLQKEADLSGANAAVSACDWRYYAEKVRKRAFDIDETAVKPYLPLDRVIEAAFDCAGRLFGLRFEPVAGLPLYHPDVRSWRVLGRKGEAIGLFLGDYFARPSKRSGAWMSSLRRQSRLAEGGERLPIIYNVCNFAKPAPGEPALLSMDDARTLFHEFGHALHGLLSDVTYPSVSGTSVSRDFVELPSQLYEHWLTTEAVLQTYARHHKTGEPMPKALIDRLRASRTFNQGFQTVEYLASAIVDMELHELCDAAAVDVDAIEAAALKRIGMPPEIGMRHRSSHFQHIVGGYAAGYYSYLWSEVLDADAFAAFEETGDIFDSAVADRLYRHIYSAGGKREAQDAYLAFRGRLPDVGPLLKKRGLAA
jgi:peptidyl-dipeptidase Dcp